MSGATSNLLLEKRETILALWVERSLAEVPSARSAEKLALRDSLPMYLEHLSLALATNRRMDAKSVFAHDSEAIRIGKLHGADRAGNTSYVLTEVISEYRILREVIFQVLESDGPLGTDERDIVYESIEQAVNDAAVKFTEVHASIQERYVSALTHDLKNPIAAARISAEMIVRSSDSTGPCVEMARTIMRSMGRATSMIDDLLDAGKVRAGEELLLHFDRCDLAAIIQAVVEDMSLIHGPRFLFDSRGAVEGNFSGEGLRRVLENLLDNAVKYGRADSVINVSLGATGEGGADISVHNEGPPIAPEELPHLFEQYHRTKSAMQSNATGWGIGLSLVKGVSKAHGGSVRVESGEGSGTTFTVQVTLAKTTPS